MSTSDFIVIPETGDEVVYRVIPGLIGYRVGNDGSVWSQRKRKDPCSGFWHRLKDHKRSHRGYRVVGLISGGYQRPFFVHRLVLEAFVGPCPEGMQCCHNDGNPENNHLPNLRWDTPRKNALDRDKHGRTARGSRNHNAKMNENAVEAIRLLRHHGWTLKKLGDAFGVSAQTIHRIDRGEVWKHVESTL